MSEPRWLDPRIVTLIHDMQIAEHGGLPGLRDEGLLESALAKPRNLHAHNPGATLWQLAAAYAIGISGNHPFADGNKRTSLVISYIFLYENGWDLVAPEIETALVFQQVADGSIAEKELADWFCNNCEEVR